MLNTPFPDWPQYEENEIKAVTSVLESNKVNYWTGKECRLFEEEFATWSDTKHAIAVSNGTVALELSLKALNIGSGDDVIVTPRSFFASASAIINVGARPIFADVDSDSQNITADTINTVKTDKTKAIICVHLAGWPCDMHAIKTLAETHGWFIIEDCAQAHGAQYHGQSVGSFGDIAAWSFCQDKIMSTGGEGGMITTNDYELWKHCWSLKEHGKSWDAVQRKDHPDGFRWLHESFGSNYRMTEMQAAIGRIQLKKMPEWHKKRLDYANIIWKTAQSIPGFRAPSPKAPIIHAAYKCYIFVDESHLKEGWSRDRIMHAINELGVPCYSGACPAIYREKAFLTLDSKPQKELPNTELLGRTSLMFLVHPTLQEEHIQKTCEVLKEVGAMAFY